MSKRKLLLADDSVTIQKVVNLTFADQGIEVMTASDGNTAMRMVSEFAPDLVMVDVNLPGLNGYEICEQIKQRHDSPSIPIILLVGSFKAFDEHRADRAGADDFLTKPFQSIGELVRKVSTLLQFEGGENFSSETETSSETRNLEDKDNFTNIDGGDLSVAKYGDRSDVAQIGDEIIQSDQIGSLPANEARKFETQLTGQPFEDFTPGAFEDARKTHFKSADEYETVGKFGAEKTRPLNSEELDEITSETADAKLGQLDARVYESVDKQNLEDAVATLESEVAADIQTNNEDEQVSERNFSEQAQSNAVDTSPLISASPEMASAFENDYFTGSDDTNIIETPVFQKTNLSSETIDAIADKIIEKLFEKIVREIVAQVVEQKADSIIKHVVEERLKE